MDILKMYERTRIGSLELRPTVSLKDQIYWEIVKWYPNIYYQQESQYIKQVDPNTGAVYYTPQLGSGFSINANCFKNPESCYTVAIIEQHNEDEPDIRSIGSRPFELTDEEYQTYTQICKGVFKSYYKHQEENYD